ncbi:MAG: AI-2E family transporter [Alphaproteobacteria bacterium]|nr:AI-2E family transporter [Alphaproteobacteria bacterium]
MQKSPNDERPPVIDLANGPNGSDRRFNVLVIELAIRLFAIGALIYWTFIIVLPFAAIILWSVVLAVALYPIFRVLAELLGGRPITAAVLMTLAGLVLIIGPVTWMAVGAIDPIKSVMAGIETGDIAVPPPPASIKEWPFVGEQLYSFWLLASTNLRSAFTQILPQLKPAGEFLLDMAKSAGAGTLKFLVSVLLMGFILAAAPQMLAGARALSRRIDPSNGEKFVDLAGATINAVSRGVMGLSLMQAVVGGLGMYLADVPGASLLTIAILVLGIIQIGPLLVVAPVIFWAWTTLASGPALALTVCMLSVNYMDNVLKPFIFAHGLSTPIPVIFVGVIGGVLAHGIAGLFAGPVVLAVVWELAKAWIADDLKAVSENGVEPDFVVETPPRSRCV